MHHRVILGNRQKKGNRRVLAHMNEIKREQGDVHIENNGVYGTQHA